MTQIQYQPQHQPHLSEDDFDDILIGCESRETATHLGACPTCRQRMTEVSASMETSMAAFNQASRAWSEARSNALPSHILSTRRGSGWIPVRQWQAAAALGVVFCFTAGLQLLHRPTPNAATPSEAAASVHNAHNPVEIESDNAMLADIDSEMGSPQPDRFGLTVENPAGLEADGDGSSTSRPDRQARD
jgi:hypothetical protein